MTVKVARSNHQTISFYGAILVRPKAVPPALALAR